MRRNFQSVRTSLIPQSLGACASNGPALLAYVNAATERLVLAGGETGWWGTWDKVVFNVARTDPFLITPSNVARIINMDVCTQPIKIQNGFYEMLESGVGYQETNNPSCRSKPCSVMQAFDRGTQPFYSTVTAGSFLRVFPTNAADVGKRVFFSGTDINDRPVSSVDNGAVVPGVFVTLDLPYVDTPLAFNTISGVQKDLTLGAVSVYQIDADSTLTLLGQYGPNEQFPSFRKYFLGGLPANCCGGSTVATVQIQAMCKREFVPYTNDMDELLIGNLEALRAECQAVRYSEMDGMEGSQKEIASHRKAIKFLQDELDHYLDRERPAINFAPFGTATGAYRAIGQMI